MRCMVTTNKNTPPFRHHNLESRRTRTRRASGEQHGGGNISRGDMLLKAKEEFNAWLSRYGRSTCDGIMREHLRKRLDVTDRPARIRVSASARRDMYARQSGKCGICGKEMEGGNLSRLDVDHINPELTGPAFNHRSNMTLCHASCNRSKGAASVADQAKRYGRTMNDILRSADEQPDDEPIAADWPDEPPENERPVSEAEYRGAAADYEAERHRA